jgi:hypothetical protein
LVPQGHQYDIYEDLGYIPVSYVTPILLALVHAPPIAIGLVTAVYSGVSFSLISYLTLINALILSMRTFFNRRKKLQALMSNHESMNTNICFRLICLAAIDVLLTVLLGSYAVYQKIDTAGLSAKRYPTDIFAAPSLCMRHVTVLLRKVRLVGTCLLGSLFLTMQFMPAGHRIPLKYPNPEKRTEEKEASPHRTLFNLYKPPTPFKISVPPQPNLQIVAIK